MIDFRYHLVSIIAIFLALAVGIVLGTTTLNGVFLDGLRSQINQLTGDKRALENTVTGLRSEVRAADEFAASQGPALVARTLEDQRVLLVVTPDTPSQLAERLIPLLERAGAQVTGQLRLLPALSDPQNGRLVEDLVAKVVPAGLALPAGQPVERATAELSAALGRRPGAGGVDAGEAQAVVSAFEEADLVQYSGTSDALQQATTAVVLAAPAPDRRPDDAAQRRQQALLSMAGALDDRSGGVVLAGPAGSTGPFGVLRVLREDSGVAGRVSSVDNADRGVGLVAVVSALAEQLRGAVGQYGSGSGASGPLPTPAP